ncbi:formiminotetrahydrofolate cyclodeaminase [Geosporobacter subterraneus DSM 17957]|uniref:Formiminotetrahydrofolate cyclodeaminase n=1 Tax=Geosporobacter subterraneus DSM 17957 TaxID=1121919 RepID=A0A1M6LYX6_9FIRM|nr:cyclodeaminase/cyclohydrolase family protein [Geosporobacter subterraneus]SHJ76406.1 formiminotetrahydrofolate cyclodeaminase [Geosporobacter subterraneus DSM 17957]
MLVDLNIKGFLEETASNAPVPGGGSIAALSGAISAALTEMVANLTIGKKGYEGLEAEMEQIAEAGAKLREKLAADIDRDSDAFNQVMAAFKLPKGTEEEVEARKAAIQEATKNAALVPLEVATDVFHMMKQIAVVVEKGNKNAVTDGAVAAMMARTAVLSALYNVKINLGSIKDETFVKEATEKVQQMEHQVQEIEKEILSKVVL